MLSSAKALHMPPKGQIKNTAAIVYNTHKASHVAQTYIVYYPLRASVATDELEDCLCIQSRIFLSCSHIGYSPPLLLPATMYQNQIMVHTPSIYAVLSGCPTVKFGNEETFSTCTTNNYLSVDFTSIKKPKVSPTPLRCQTSKIPIRRERLRSS
jgi:hypothetical protein